MKGKKFLAFYRNGSQTEHRILNGRGEKRQFLLALKKSGGVLLEISRVRRPLQTLPS